MMMKWGIRGRVLFLALIPMVSVAALLAIYFTNAQITDIERSLNSRGLAIVRQLAPASEYGVFAGNKEILQGLTDAAMHETDVIAVSITDAQGNLLAKSGGSMISSAVYGGSDGLSTIQLDNGQSVIFSAPVYQSETQVDDYSLGAVPTKASATRPGSRKILGRITVELSRVPTLERKNQILFNGLGITLLGVFASVLLALRMGQGVIKPIHQLAAAVRKISRGNFDVRVESKSGGELEILEDGINSMAETLKSAHADMQDKILEATARLSYQAAHDMLTGLVNRREFEIRVERALHSAHEQGRVHTLCYMDLDQFKVVNDTCGHVAGDELLRQLALMLQQVVRDRDTLARLGGDEFGVLLENCPLEKAQELAENLRQTVQDYRFLWHEKSFVVGASIGLVEISEASDSVVSILSAADAACYAAKDKGRNRIHVYELEDSDLARRHGEMQWVSRISRAIEDDRLRLFYQPIIPLDKSENGVSHFEILLRMVDEDGNLVLPMAFIPAAERYQLMPTIDRWVIKHAFQLCTHYCSSYKNSPLSTCTINLSGSSLCDDHFLEFIKKQLELNRVPAASICFEITETAAIANLPQAIEFMKALKAMGCQFSLDDFGSGLSSFTYLKNLPVDYLKIDGSFVKDMADDPIDFAMVQAITSVGHVMGLQTIAEFVESEDIFNRLKEIGVDYVQGSWIEKPRAVTELINSPAKVQDGGRHDETGVSLH
jgi:diguanylate cyclase (GGDEF)-like protein